MKVNDNTAVLLIHCPDKAGILAAVTEFINQHKGNILYLDQYVNREEKVFFMRVEWDLTTFQIPKEKIEEYFQTLLAIRYDMNFRLYFADTKPRMAIFVSKMSHCLYDLLARYASGEWRVEIPLVISNHPDMKPVAERFGIEYHYIPITKENKEEQEAKQLELLKEHNIYILRPCTLYANSFAGTYQQLPEQNHQHSPLVFTGFCRSETLSCCPRTRRKNHWRNKPLCYRRTRCRSDYRARRYAHFAQGHCG